MSINIQIIRDTFSAIAPHADEVLAHFYDTLFERHPEAKPLFAKADMAQQRKALAGALGFVINNWEKQGTVVEFLQKAGARHVAYGAETPHYDWVADALLSTLSYFFESAWTPEVERQWKALYGVAATQMMAGAEKTRKASPSDKGKRPGINIELVEELVVKNPTLEEMIRSHARDIIRSALAEEAYGVAQDFAREKAQGILRSVIESEAESLRKLFANKKKAEVA